MIIDKEILSEKNYTGTRLIPVDNKKLDELQKELTECQKEINPILDKLNAEYYPKIDPLYQELSKINEHAKEYKSKIAAITLNFKEDTEKIESIEQKATLIKNKMQPLIQEEIKGQLGEFEIARHTTVKDGKIFVEVYDEIEEKIKFIRANKAK